MTEIWLTVESLQLELILLRENVSSSTTGVSTNADQLDMMMTDMNSLWLLLGSILVMCKYCSCTLW